MLSIDHIKNDITTNSITRTFIIVHITSLKMNLFPNMLETAHCG